MKSIPKFLYIVCTIVFVLNASKTSAQSSYGSFYVFKADWSYAKSYDKCTYFMEATKKSDTEYVCRYYNKFGPMVKQECYRDSSLSIPNGFFCWYNEKGEIDSCGWVLNSKKDGRWDYFIGDTTYYDEYNNGQYIKRDFYHSLEDSGKTKRDIAQKEAVFKTGAWNKYLERNFEIPKRFTSIFHHGVYTATVCFMINKQGKISNVYLVKSLEWSADKEVIRVIENGPSWQPAIQKGEPVLYKQMQNITFSVD